MLNKIKFGLFVAILASAVMVSPAQAKEGFFARWNPMRYFRPAEQASDKRPQTFAESMAARGFDQETIDQRTARIDAARETGGKTAVRDLLQEYRNEDQSRIKEIRAELKSRGLRPEQVEASLPTAAQQPSTRDGDKKYPLKQNFRMENRRGGSPASQTEANFRRTSRSRDKISERRIQRGRSAENRRVR